MLFYWTILHFKSFKLVVHSTYFLQGHHLPSVQLPAILVGVLCTGAAWSHSGEIEILHSNTAWGVLARQSLVATPVFLVLHWHVGGRFSPVICWKPPEVNTPSFLLQQGQMQPKVESLSYGNTKQSPSQAVIRRLFLGKSEQDSVKMLKAKPHLWPYGTNLLVWICEIHFFR